MKEDNYKLRIGSQFFTCSSSIPHCVDCRQRVVVVCSCCRFGLVCLHFGFVYSHKAADRPHLCQPPRLRPTKKMLKKCRSFFSSFFSSTKNIKFHSSAMGKMDKCSLSSEGSGRYVFGRNCWQLLI